MDNSQARNLFDGLFVLEITNNHLGRLDRGIKIVEEHARIVRFNNVKAAMKLQFRDVDNFVHKDFTHRKDIRYINRTLSTKLSKQDFVVLVRAIKENGCIPMSTPWDERSVDLCVDLDLPIIKIASADINDWLLIEKIAATKKPVIVSNGGSSLKDMDDIVLFFKNRNIPLAINHCVAIYPSEDNELELNQIDFLRNRYPDNIIGFSDHEYHDWHSSVKIAYAKGARTFERHIDINSDGLEIAKYSSLPEQIDIWFKAYKKAVEMCGGAGTQLRVLPQKEIKHLDTFVRGIYAKRDLPKGYKFTSGSLNTDVYAAIPLQKGQISCRELMYGEALLKDIKQDEPIMIDIIDSPYANNEALKQSIYDRGLAVEEGNGK